MLIFWGNKKNTANCRLLNFLSSMLSVKAYPFSVHIDNFCGCIFFVITKIGLVYFCTQEDEPNQGKEIKTKFEW